MRPERIAELMGFYGASGSVVRECLDEIERLQADNARLAAEMAEYERTEPMKKAECRGLVDQLVKLDSAIHGCYADALALNDGHEWPISKAILTRLHDLTEDKE